MKERMSRRFWMVMVIFSLTGQIAWVVENMYFNVFIYRMFRADAASISLMVALSAVTATLTTLLVGALSDRAGKRKIFICHGYVLWGISILLFSLIRADILTGILPAGISAAAAGVSAVIVMDCVMTFFGSAANDACFNAWLTESAAPGLRGRVEGINAMMPLLAILIVFGGFMSFDLDSAFSWTVIYVIIGLLVLGIGICGFFWMEESDTSGSGSRRYREDVLYGFRPSAVRRNRCLYAVLLAYTVFGISIQVFMPYLILYYTVTLKLENYVFVMAPAIILASAVTAFYGRVYDGAGFIRSALPPVFMLCFGFCLLAFFRSTAVVFFGSFFIMAGYLTGMTVFGAAIRDRTPRNRTGMIQGIRITAQVLIPGVTGPVIGAFVLKNADKIMNDDGTMSFVPNENIFYAALIAAILLIPVLIWVSRIEKKEVIYAAGSNGKPEKDRIRRG